MVRVRHRALVFCPPDVLTPPSPPVGETAEMQHSTASEADFANQWELAGVASEAVAEEQDSQLNGDALDQESQPLLNVEGTAGDTADSDARSRTRARSDDRATPDVEAQESGGPWEWLLPILERLALPVLDARFSMLAPVCSLDGQLSEQDTILRKLQLCSKAGLFQVAKLPC